MVETTIWILIIVCFGLSFAGIIFPVLPSPLFVWIGFLLYFFVIEAGFSLLFWGAMTVLTILLIISDIIANSYFVKRFGGSKTGERIAAVGVILGSFIVPPFGIILVPFLAVFATEMIQQRTTKEAWRASIGSLIGFLGGAVAKFVILAIMVVWFFIQL